jgi:GntR family transcriptional regulator
MTSSLPQIRIDRDSPVPFYFQLAALLEQEIGRHRWQPGERLPSESELGEHFQLSRTTVRQALARLEQEGMVNRRKGYGTFVASASPRIWLVQSQEGFFQDEVSRMGRAVASEILDRRVDELPHWAADALGVSQGTEGVVMERLRLVDGKLAMSVTDCLPVELADVVLAMDGTQSLYERLREVHGLEVSGGRRFLEAVTAGKRLARLLEVGQGDPLIFIESVSWDSQMRPFHSYRSWLRTDRMRVEIQVSKASGRTQIGALPGDGQAIPDMGEG